MVPGCKMRALKVQPITNERWVWLSDKATAKHEWLARVL